MRKFVKTILDAAIGMGIGYFQSSGDSSIIFMLAMSGIDHIGKDGKVDVRAFYGESKLKYKDIHTTAHGNPKQHPYGEHGEHVHDYTWGDDGTLKNKITRGLSKEERKENGDIL